MTKDIKTLASKARLTPEQEDRKWAQINPEIGYEGEKITLPDSPDKMPIRKAIEQLARIEKDENQLYAVDEMIPGVHYYDGLVALGMALKERYGFVATDNYVETFFGRMKTAPIIRTIMTGPSFDDRVQVPEGNFSFPNVEVEVKTEMGMQDGMPVVRLVGEVKKKDRWVITEIVHLAREIAKLHSIYRSKSVVLDSNEKTNQVDLKKPLHFFDPTSGIEVPIFDADTEKLIDQCLLAPLQHSAECRKMRVPLRRGILLEGPYGTGKTLTARKVAKVANENGWTFILVKHAQALKSALNFARNYQPAVVFVEDIDRIAGNRNEGANNLINEIDGIVGKTDEIMTVVTTNFAEKIDKAFLRPGRLDVVVSLRAPEADAVERLIRFYGGSYIKAQEDVADVCKELAGQIPATIREVVERSKLAMMTEGRINITATDLHLSIVGMNNHRRLLDGAAEGTRSEESFNAIIRRVVRDVMVDNFHLVDHLAKQGKQDEETDNE